MNLKQFIKKANEIHGKRYNYSEAIFTGITHGLTIICKEHGPFMVTPNAHINHEVGCKVCAETPKETTNKKPLVLEED